MIKTMLITKLYYNDYGLENERKRRNCVTLLRGMIERGVPIDGVGTQSHFGLESFILRS